MNATRIGATARRVLAQLRHDPRSIALMILAPLLLTGLFAWMFDGTPVFQQVGPIALALFPFIIMFLITSITTLRERRGGTLERLLTTPIARGEFIAGYALAFALMAAVQAAAVTAFAIWVCGLEVEGPAWLLIAVSIVGAIAGMAMGLFTSAFAATEFQAVQFLPALVFPQILIGGVFVARDQMPDALRVIGDWLPLSHAIDGIHAVTAESDPGWDLGRPLVELGAWALAFLVAGALTLRRRTA